ncbi:MAG: NAD-glutamate dehydrogenase domain-containing protein, partial [Myxococcota bacterium]
GLVEQLPRDRPLVSAKVHTAADGGLVLDVFRFGAAAGFDSDNPAHQAKLDATVAYARGLGEGSGESGLRSYVEQCSGDFVRAASPLRLYETWRLTEQVRSTQEVACGLYRQTDPRLARISVVCSQTDTRAFFERLVRHLGRVGFDITRAFVDVHASNDADAVVSLGFVVKDPDGRLNDDASPTWHALRSAMKRLRWLDTQVLERLEIQPQLNLIEAEILVTLTRLVHPVLAPINPFAFTRDRLFDILDRQPTIASKIARTFIRRFIEQTGDQNDAAWSAIEQMVDSQVDAATERQFFETLLSAAQKVHYTNLARENRLGLALSVDASLFARSDRQAPTSVAFVHADGTDGFHVRFRPIARGGVRAVVPKGAEQYLREAERLFEEVYDLAMAQQLKNKDIPEGGAKGVVLVAPGTTAEDGVKAYIDGLLDLIDAAPNEDRLYLGPDENISPPLIEWVVNRASVRGYPEPTAFMSSKPGAGINHKAFGVTSEGVTVFLEEALKAAGIDPSRQPFTVKMTGGPAAPSFGGKCGAAIDGDQ